MVTGPFLQLKSIPQQTVRAPADPRYLEKIIFRGEFNAVEYEILGTLFSPVFQNLRSIFYGKISYSTALDAPH